MSFPLKNVNATYQKDDEQGPQELNGDVLKVYMDNMIMKT